MPGPPIFQKRGIMAGRKRPGRSDEDTETPVLPAPTDGPLVRVIITKFGDGKVSTGTFAMGKGDIMARRGDVIEISVDCARSLEEAGLAELVE